MLDARQPEVGPVPFALRDAPSLIERVFPAQKVGVEAQKERKSGAGQTLTALGSYWKGRKPLVLVRACVLGALLPASDDPEADLALFEALLGMDETGLWRRRPAITADLVVAKLPRAEWEASIEIDDAPGPEAASAGNAAASRRRQRARWRRLDRDALSDPAAQEAERARLVARRHELERRAFARLSFAEQVRLCERVERVERLGDRDDPLYAGLWERVNARLRTTARTLPELVEQLGIMRFGHRPVVGDPFCGGGSIPFEAARIGCDVVASDLNPIACMLTWGALHVVGADAPTRARMAAEQARVAAAVDAEITRLGIEHDAAGNRAKAYLYCLETVDPQTGWLVPMAPSWVISRNRRTIAKLVPDPARKRFDIVIESDVSAAALDAAERGTVRDGDLVYDLATPEGAARTWRLPIARLRGDGEGPPRADGSRGNRLRAWERTDIVPRRPVWDAQASPVLEGAPPGAWRGGDILLERLYCIQWMAAADLAAGKARPATFFSAPTDADLAREAQVEQIVAANLARWQEDGLVPDMVIEPGDKTDEPIRTRGWTHWHHLFMPRALLNLSMVHLGVDSGGTVTLARLVDRSSRLCRLDPRNESAGRDITIQSTFYNLALNPLSNFGCRSWAYSSALTEMSDGEALTVSSEVKTCSATSVDYHASLWIHDPPYADAVNYHEITEFFIAWLRKNPPAPFDAWVWDSRRPLAIKGKDEGFRRGMIDAFAAMAAHMPDNGLQVVMFTHQDAGVWADMAQIVWAAGLQVTAAWYVSTETTSELKQGGYVQGTVLLCLRKRRGGDSAYTDELVPLIRARVAAQVRTLVGLNQRARAAPRSENPFSDADIQMAGYAAALEVLTGYTAIDGRDMTREALRARVKGESSVVDAMIELAVQTATELMVPEGFDAALWQRLAGDERFWLKMAEIERTRGHLAGKLDDYQNFAKAFRCAEWRPLMASAEPNKARLKGARDFGRGQLDGEFGAGVLRRALFGVRVLAEMWLRSEEPAGAATVVISNLRDLFGADWLRRRADVIVLADWLGGALDPLRPEEASAARVLAGVLRAERL